MATIHFVEENASLRASFIMLFRGERFDTIVYSSYEELICNYKKNSVSEECIVADLHIKRRSSIELLKMLKQNGVSAPIIICTGEFSTALMAAAFKNGVFDYHIKPVDVDKFLNSIYEAFAYQKNCFVESGEITILRSQLAGLSLEEKQVLEMLQNGDSKDAIAAKLRIEMIRVLQHSASAMTKMGAAHLPDLVRKSFITNTRWRSSPSGVAAISQP